MKTTVIHHSADWDGLFCREIARKFLPDAELIGWDFPDKPLAIPDGQIYILDLPVDRVFGNDVLAVDDGKLCFLSNTPPPRKIGLNRIVWIDHHKSSIQNHPEAIPGYRIDGVAACRLAWQWFSQEGSKDVPLDWKRETMPCKQDYIDRQVSEPIAVTLAGEYDIWEHKLSNGDDIAFQFGLDSFSNLRWDWLLNMRPNDPDPDGYVARTVEAGKGSMQCYAKRDADVMRSRSFIVQWEGLKFLALNTARCNSNTFAALDVPETGHDALMAFAFSGKGWNFSLYHAAHRKDIDLSVIATKHGGGGHRGACGFRVDKLPSSISEPCQ